MLDRVAAEAFARYGDRPLLYRPDGTPVAYAALGRRVAAAAGALAGDGIGEGALVALTMPSDERFVVAYLALAHLGAITAGVSPRLAAPEQAAALARARPDRVLTGDDVDAAGDGGGPAPALVPADPDRPVAVVFTSGTTGVPKGAVFTGAQLDAIATIDAGGLAPGSGRPMLASTQFAHVGFMTKLPWYLQVGAAMCIMDRWRAPDALALIAEHRMAGIGGVAAQIGLMLRVPDFDRYDLSSVRTIVVGAGPSPPALVTEARRRFGAAYSIRYSSTESGGVGTATAFDADDEEALETVGRPRPGVEIRVERGEVQLRSPAMMTSYWRDDEATAAAFTGDGWLRTGDAGAIDARGCLRIRGRLDDAWIRGGYNVAPAPIEAALGTHPAVVAVAVVPRPDAVMGEIGVAVVVPADPSAPPSLDDLRRHAALRVAHHELPEDLLVVGDLPLTAGDKIDRRALIARVRAS
jgi:acyl-CoA synthetase (AMP-forming)/AMP-acid ligase II